MKGRFKIYRWLLTIWILIGCETAAYSYTQATLPSAWRTTPTLSTDMQPAYQFRSTSAYTPTVNVTVYTPGSSMPSYGPRRDPRDPWGDPEDDEEQGQVNTPVGEPLALLLLAMIYLFRCFYRKRIMDDGRWTMDNR